MYSSLLVLLILAAWLKLAGLRPGLHGMMYVPLLKKNILEVDIVKSEAIPKSKHRNSKVQDSLPNHPIKSFQGYWSAMGSNGSPPLQKNVLEFLPTFCMWKAKGPKNPAHFLYILGRCQISILQLSFLESQPCRGSVIAVPQSVETWCFFFRLEKRQDRGGDVLNLVSLRGFFE